MGDAPTMVAASVPRLRRGWRLFIFFSSAVLLCGAVSMLFSDLLWRTGWSAARTVLLVLFIILFFFAAVGCMHGLYGFFLRLLGHPPVHHPAGHLARPKHRGHQHGHCLSRV